MISAREINALWIIVLCLGLCGTHYIEPFLLKYALRVLLVTGLFLLFFRDR